MALAVEKSCLLATEDSTLQSIAESVGVSITNTATLLYYIYKENHMAKQQCIMLLDLLGQYGYNKEIILEIKEEMLVITRFPTDNPDKTISMVRFSLEGRGKGQE